LAGDVHVRAFRDGMIAFSMGRSTPRFDSVESQLPAHDELSAWLERSVRLANAHLACLAAVIQALMHAPSGVATYWSVLQVDFDSGKLRTASEYTTGGTRVSLWSAREGWGAFDWRFYRGWPLVTTEQIEHSFELLDLLLKRPAQDMTLLRAEMLFRAHSGLAHGDWAGALTNAWSAIEGLLGELLGQYIENNRDRPAGNDESGNTLRFINGDRRAFLEGREMTGRHTVELLSLLDVLPFNLYRACTRCASARNDWLHNQAEPSPDVAHVATRALGEIFALVEGVLHTRWSGLSAPPPFRKG